MNARLPPRDLGGFCSAHQVDLGDSSWSVKEGPGAWAWLVGTSDGVPGEVGQCKHVADSQ